MLRWRGRRANVALAAAGSCVLALGGFALAAQVGVQLGQEGPQPATVTVNWGDTVAFSNADTEVHKILIPRAEATSPDIAPGSTFLHVFDRQKGAFSYVQTGTKTRAGRVLVQLQGEVILKAVPEQVTFGQSAALSGNSPYPSSPVVISQRPIGSQKETEIVTVMAAEDGSFAASFRPESGSRLRASVAAGQLRSNTVTVAVAPRLTISVTPTTQKAGRFVRVTGRVAPANAAKRLHLDRYNAQRKEWDRVSTKPVSAGATVFRWKAERGRSLLRLGITRIDLQPGFKPAVSRSVAVKGVTVAFAPRLTIAVRPTTLKAGRTVRVTGRLAPADAARRVHLDRYNAQRKRWDRLSTKPVANSGAVVFRWRAVKGRSLLRLSVERADLRPGYLRTVSRPVAVRGLAPVP